MISYFDFIYLLCLFYLFLFIFILFSLFFLAFFLSFFYRLRLTLSCIIAAPSNSLPSQIQFLGYAGQVLAIPASTEQVILCGEWIVVFWSDS